MGKTVGAYEAKTRLSELLVRVGKGERITITRHGTAVARLVPAEPGAGTDWGKIRSGFARLRSSSKPGPAVRELRDEGRRG